MYIFVIQTNTNYTMYKKEEPKILFRSTVSHRQDLSTEIRLKIATIVLFFSIHGTVTKLSQRYNISRRFVYDLKESLELYCQNSPTVIEAQRNDKILKSYETALLFRLDGKCSINSISVTMKHLDIPYASVGQLSEQLRFAGKSLENTLSKQENIIYCIFASDEIYAKQRPILITCCPVSYMILHIKLCNYCTSEEWEKEWEKLKNNGVIPLYLTKDEGTQMECAAKCFFSDVDIQSDTYHGVAHKLGLWHKRLEALALNKIELEYEKEKLLSKSKTDKTIAKRKLEYEQAKESSSNALDFLDDFEFIYYNLLSCFECINCSGELKNKQEVTQKFKATLELGIECLNHETITKRLKSILKIQKKLFYFYDIAGKTLENLKKENDIFVLELICLYWQIHKRYIKRKEWNAKEKIKIYENSVLADIKELTGENFEDIFDKIIKTLNTIVQSSSAVECINSILRPYLNTCKNQVTQEFLNLFMFYHNHRRFKAGERKGKTPMELFSGEQQKETWLKLLMKKLEKKIIEHHAL